MIKNTNDNCDTSRLFIYEVCVFLALESMKKGDTQPEFEVNTLFFGGMGKFC